MTFEFISQDIKDLVLIKPKIFNDNRGFFLESYKKSEFESHGIYENFIQDNHSRSKKYVLRGLHYQAKPFAQAKLIRCTKGKILDIAVDLRPNSKTFCQHIKVELSEENKNIFYIPKGFAHGFVTLSEEAEIQYKTDNEYNMDADRGVFWNDKSLNIDWGLDFEPIISDKDKSLPLFSQINLEEID